MSVTWRDSASQECQDDFDSLVDQCIDVAANNLVRNWGLDPTAIVVDPHGEQSVLMAEDSTGLASRDELVRSLKGSASSTRSFAIVTRVRDESSSNLLEIHLEHRDVAIQMVFPYEIPDASTFDLGTPRAAQSSHWLFSEGLR